MMVIGFVLIAAAVAAATILIVQNTGHVQVHALGHAWFISASWLVVFGLVLLAVAAVGLAAVRHSGARRMRRQRAVVAEPAVAPVTRSDSVATDAAADEAEEPVTRRGLFHRHRPAM